MKYRFAKMVAVTLPVAALLGLAFYIAHGQPTSDSTPFNRSIYEYK